VEIFNMKHLWLYQQQTPTWMLVHMHQNF